MLRYLVRPLPPTVQDAALLAARVLLGVVLFAHGWQMLTDMGYDGTAAGFDGLGVPLPQVSAAFLFAVQLVGAPLLVLGALTRVVGVLAFVNLAGAVWFVHRENGLYVSDGGWELAALVGLFSLLFAAIGPGRISLDALVGRRVAGDQVAHGVHDEDRVTLG